MDLDHDRCYRALESRDGRFDGRFFTGVRTTGVYCRPVCPARTPKRENVRFFACAAAAEDAGFRPCKRCRPERSAGLPVWPSGSDLVSRALGLINEGALDDGDVEALAARLSIGARQLRRVFDAHLGAGPLAIARARRIHFARALLDETSLPVAQVAFAAGFGSIRQFNLDVRKTFGATPTALRNGAARRNGALTVRLSYRPPLDWRAMTDFVGARATLGVEVVARDVYRRSLRTPAGTGTLALAPAAGGESALTLTLALSSSERLLPLADRARRLFDLRADPVTIGAHLARDPLLRRGVRARPGLRVPGAWDPFELAVRAVLGQQISVAAATTLAGRVAARYGTPLNDGETVTTVFPDAAALAEADVTEVGATRAQARTIRALATGVASGELTFDTSLGLDEFVARWCEIPGVGPWTAHYVAMRACGEPDAFPASDLGLRKAASATSTPASEAELARMAEAWRPWRAYAAMHLWNLPSGGTR